MKIGWMGPSMNSQLVPDQPAKDGRFEMGQAFFRYSVC